MDAFLLDVNHDEMVVRLISSEITDDCIKTPEELTEALREANVVRGIHDDVIAEAFQTLPDLEEAGVEFVIAEGKRAKAGEHGRIDFLVDVSGQAIFDVRAEEEDEAIDFKNATHVVAVEPGQVLAKIIPPTEGTPGYTLSGKELAAKNGKTPVFRAGEGIEIDIDDVTVRATQEGRPVYAHYVLSVSALYEIGGDVCYETGNVKFNGHVYVRGNVQDEFSIEAKTIEVQGVVGASNIRCAGDLTVRGGINGHDKADIFVGGNAYLKYVNQAKLEVRGEVQVAREILNSRVWSRNRILARKIIGGESMALLGIEAQFYGSEIGAPTLLLPGGNYEVRRIEQAMDILSGHIQKILKPISIFFGDRSRYLGLMEQKKEEIRAAYDSFTRLRVAYEKLLRARKAIQMSEELQPVRELIVLKRLYQDVTVKTEYCIKRFRVEVGGPAALLEDIDTSSFRIVSYIPGRGIAEDEEGGEGEGGGTAPEGSAAPQETPKRDGKRESTRKFRPIK